MTKQGSLVQWSKARTEARLRFDFSKVNSRPIVEAKTVPRKVDRGAPEEILMGDDDTNSTEKDEPTNSTEAKQKYPVSSSRKSSDGGEWSELNVQPPVGARKEPQQNGESQIVA